MPNVCDWPADEIRRIGYQVVDLIAEQLTNLPQRPVFEPFPAALAAEYLDSRPPERGEAADAVIARFAREIAPYPFGNGHPRFYGWVNSPPAVIGIFADTLAAAMNPSCAGGNHAAIYVERQIASWFAQIVGFPAGTMGLLVSGASMAALTALAVARHVKAGFDVRAEGVQRAASPLVVYKSGETHGCHQKAVEMLGIGRNHLRTVSTNAAQQMIPSSLDRAIADDVAHGYRPIAVVASAGTVNSGAIDPIDEIADVCAAHDVWLHVDGAYGAPAILTASCRDQLSAIARADSLALDPHKWLYVPVEAGLVLIKDAAAMRSAFSLVPPYLRTDGNTEGVGGLPWLSEYGFQQTRAFRALKVWMALRQQGTEGYRDAIEHDLALARRLADRIREADDMELFEPQSLSIVCFRVKPRPGVDADRFNSRVLERVQLGGEAFVSSTEMRGALWLRACIVNPRASEADVDSLVEVVRTAAGKLAAV